MPPSKFVDVFGDYSPVRIINLFLENPRKEYTLKEIVEGTNSDNPLADAFVSRLVLRKYLLKEDSTYRINLENPIIKQFLELRWDNHNGPSCE